MDGRYCEKRRNPGESVGIFGSGPTYCLNCPVSLAMFVTFWIALEIAGRG